MNTKTILITGGTTRIGLATAQLLTAQGGNLIVTELTLSELSLPTGAIEQGHRSEEVWVAGQRWSKLSNLPGNLPNPAHHQS